MVSKVYPFGKLKTYKYVVIISEYQDKILLSRHKERSSWEYQGGHIEPGETPEEAAVRELMEESGAEIFDMKSVCDYWAGDPKTNHGANGAVFAAHIKKLGKIPESEIAEVRCFDYLPSNLTYPAIIPVLFAKKMIGKEVTVTTDRPIGSRHLEHQDIIYPVNHGYVNGILANDGEEQDAYIIGINKPVTEFTGIVKAVIHRFDDSEQKWVVCPKNFDITEEVILAAVGFQEKFFNITIIM